MKFLSPPAKAGKHTQWFIMATVLIDAIGLGLILPVMPDLVMSLTGLPLSAAAMWGGYLAFTYAFMQFLCAPILGNLSDRFGRRVVILASLAALCVDYLVMAFAATISVLFITRLLSGVFAATISTAFACMADITPRSGRAAAFGKVGAALGLGFVIGPVIGGLLGEYGPRAPFFAAAALAGLNVLYGLFVLPETLPREKRRPFEWRRANPLGAIIQVRKLPGIGWLVFAVFLFELSHFVYPSVWSFFAAERFGWSAAGIGLSLTLVGIGVVVVQGGLMRPMLAKLGEARTLLFGLIATLVGFIAISLVTDPTTALIVAPLTTLGAVVTPALAGLISNRAGEDVQGEVQGILSSVKGLTMVLSPLMMTQLFSHFTGPDTPVYLPSAPFIMAALLALVAAVPVWLGLRAGRMDYRETGDG